MNFPSSAETFRILLIIYATFPLWNPRPLFFKAASNSFSFCLASGSRFFGTAISTTAYWSPWTEELLKLTIPFPFRRILVPDWVPGLILQRTSPVSVRIFTSPPKTAVVKGTWTVVYTSIPSRRNPGFSSTVTFKSRSPASPPLTPGEPFPLRRILLPVSMPAGIFTS